MRQRQQHAYYSNCEELRQALGRQPCEAGIFDTIGDVMPMAVVQKGPMAVKGLARGRRDQARA
jgi:hypothetical protein